VTRSTLDQVGPTQQSGVNSAHQTSTKTVKWEPGQFSDETNRANSGSFPTGQKTLKRAKIKVEQIGAEISPHFKDQVLNFSGWFPLSCFGMI